MEARITIRESDVGFPLGTATGASTGSLQHFRQVKRVSMQHHSAVQWHHCSPPAGQAAAGTTHRDTTTLLNGQPNWQHVLRMFLPAPKTKCWLVPSWRQDLPAPRHGHSTIIKHVKKMLRFLVKWSSSATQTPSGRDREHRDPRHKATSGTSCHCTGEGQEQRRTKSKHDTCGRASCAHLRRRRVEGGRIKPEAGQRTNCIGRRKGA